MPSPLNSKISFNLSHGYRWNFPSIQAPTGLWRNGQSGRKLVRIRAEDKPTKLVTFVGKGGAGKTACALLAAQYYARMGLRTCLVIQSQDPTAEFMLGQKIGNIITPIWNDTLHAVRLESTKMLLEPLSRLKKADDRLNFSQGALGEVVGEELGVLPGMDSILAIGALERLIRFVGRIETKTKEPYREFDLIVYDGISSEETLRMIGAAERARWYVRHLRTLAEKTDTGRVTAPTFLKLVEASLKQDNTGEAGGRTSAEIWDAVDCILEKSSNTFADPLKFACYLVMDPSNCMSVNAALRYWGCAIQAGAYVAGAFYRSSRSDQQPNQSIEEKFSPLATTRVPFLLMDSAIHWDIALQDMNEDAKILFTRSNNVSALSPVTFDQTKRSVNLFLPGFDKSEIKLSQWKGGSELLVEAGDQRRIIILPARMQGKVTGAKFDNRSLVITLK